MRSWLALIVSAVIVLTFTLASPVLAGASAQKSCTPGYSPCIANKTSDVDCWGGSGNGPRYTAPNTTYSVKTGSDRYGLDSDHDGLGCEPPGR
ncbi:MAG TPA: hypothetical protein VM284_05950 [Candidatus Limnocylindria bacterium]|nr:hypothetical protein [Candidatus Limnocylindria bacterium]